jgi:hypothetical protein
MTATYEMISTTTLGTAVNSVTIGSIPSTYTDLRLIYNAINITSQDSVLITFNGDTSSNYSSTILGGNGSAAGSERRSSVPYIIVTNNYVTLVNGNGLFDFMNYSNSTTNKTVLMRSGNAADSTVASVGLWRSTSAITSINLRNGGAFTFGIGSMFTLYGIKAE